ncbi:MAG: flavodoxin family protein [Pseudobutyrivibrio sp.]|nr:flavodoxin family protein [Pseudobutyrivibrio sp.]
MKLAVIYDSKTGNTKQAAEWIVEGMNAISGAEAKAFSIDEVDEEFAKEAKAIVFGSPSYMASLTPNLHQWIFTNGGKLDLAGKLGGAFATAQYTHGGADTVIQSILTLELVKGMLCYSSGNEFGLPYIHLGPVAINNNKESHNGLENYKETFVIYGNRFATKATQLFN